jgi:hypothetical protein
MPSSHHHRPIIEALDLKSPEWVRRFSFLRLWATLDGDVAQLGVLAATGEDVHRRAYVRAVIAYLEGLTFGLKQQILDAGIQDLTPADRALLVEESFELDDRGEPQVRQLFIKLHRSIRFAFSRYARWSGADFELPVSEDGWRSLVETVRTRNRLTHPKIADDLVVSDADMRDAASAYDWFKAKHKQMLRAGMIAIFIKYGCTVEEADAELARAPYNWP